MGLGGCPRSPAAPVLLPGHPWAPQPLATEPHPCELRAEACRCQTLPGVGLPLTPLNAARLRNGTQLPASQLAAPSAHVSAPSLQL